MAYDADSIDSSLYTATVANPGHEVNQVSTCFEDGYIGAVNPGGAW